MKTTYVSTILVLVLGPLGGLAMAASPARSPNPSAESSAGMHQVVDFSPRQFCRSRGGDVRETVVEHVYLCCYEAMQKCVVTDTEQSVSQLIP